MGQLQNNFLEVFKLKFIDKFKDADPNIFIGGLGASNRSRFKPENNYNVRKVDRERKTNEDFELGDLRIDYKNKTIIVEFESNKISIANLVKYWAFSRGMLEKKPEKDIIICHFSSWKSNASHRELWEWTLEQIKADKLKKKQITAKQFDHHNDNLNERSSQIEASLNWIEKQIKTV